MTVTELKEAPFYKQTVAAFIDAAQKHEDWQPYAFVLSADSQPTVITLVGAAPSLEKLAAARGSFPKGAHSVLLLDNAWTAPDAWLRPGEHPLRRSAVLAIELAIDREALYQVSTEILWEENAEAAATKRMTDRLLRPPLKPGHES